MNKKVKQQILDKIREYDKILIFRHTRLDGDCVGSTRGMKALIQLTWPEKDVRIADSQTSDYLSFLGEDDGPVPEDMFPDALAIVIDTASADRVSDQRFRLCREVVKIDHHIDREPYGTLSWVEDGRSSACEMIADFYGSFQDVLKIDQTAATYIYTGMVTDSGRFQYEGVKGDTLRLAGLMLDQGVDAERLFANLYLKDFASLKFKAHILQHMGITENGVAYVYIDRAMQEQFNLTLEAASATISYLSDIKGSLCWLAFIEYVTPEGERSIRVRLRSRFMTVNGLAENYRGGGHACASGATVLNEEEMQQLLRDADALLRDYKETHEGWL